MHDDERPKRTWREIDQARQGGGQRREPQAASKPTSQAYRSYKTQLNRLFDGGAVPEALANKLGAEAIDQSPSAKRAVLSQAIVTAATPKALLQALQAYESVHGFPDEEPVLLKLLDSSQESVVGAAVAGLAARHARQALKRAAATRARLKTVEITFDDPELQAAARALIAKL